MSERGSIGFPMDVGWEDSYHIAVLMVHAIWKDAIEAGLDPNKLIVKCYELGDGKLQVGFKTDKDSPDFIFGRAVPEEFWWTRDGHVLYPWHLATHP